VNSCRIAHRAVQTVDNPYMKPQPLQYLQGATPPARHLILKKESFYA
jgi:hypothetical protein